MDKKIIKFGKTEIEKYKFHQHKNSISIYNVYTNKTLVFNEAYFGKRGFKYFIDYKNGKKVKPLCLILPKMSAYRKDFDETKYMVFL